MSFLSAMATSFLRVEFCSTSYTNILADKKILEAEGQTIEERRGDRGVKEQRELRKGGERDWGLTPRWTLVNCSRLRSRKAIFFC